MAADAIRLSQTERVRPCSQFAKAQMAGDASYLERTGNLLLSLPGVRPDLILFTFISPSGFKKGRLYELIYTAKHPRVVGLGFAAVRDAISFFRFESQDDVGNTNPLATSSGPDVKYAYIFGISQSGRFITHMIYQGFHVDEEDRMVFEGARPHVAGGGKGGFNYRFAQTTHHQKASTGQLLSRRPLPVSLHA